MPAARAGALRRHRRRTHRATPGWALALSVHQPAPVVLERTGANSVAAWATDSGARRGSLADGHRGRRTRNSTAALPHRRPGAPGHRRHPNAEPFAVSVLRVDLEPLTSAVRRDLANALLRAAWSATLQATRILLLDLLIEADESALEEPGP